MADSYHPTGLAAYKPAEIARRIDETGVQKAQLALVPLAALGVLAGVFIGFGGVFYVVVMTGAGDLFGPARVLGGVAFSLGLILVVVGEAVARTAEAVADAKFALDPLQAFARGILCNALVCLAIWLTFAAKTAGGKILCILWPITAFVALGFEHSVANMTLLPLGMVAGATGTQADVAVNLAVVTLGNIVGGAGGVALIYWAIYLRGQPG